VHLDRSNSMLRGTSRTCYWPDVLFVSIRNNRSLDTHLQRTLPVLCPIQDAKGEGYGSLHHFVLVSVVDAGLTLR
jgi:hypothetical protein